MRRTPHLGLAALLILSLLTGCAGDKRPPEAGLAVDTPAPSEVPTEAFAATLDFAPDQAATAGYTAKLTLTNTGLGDDEYFLRVTPNSAGQVSPPAVSLVSGESVQVTVRPRVGQQLTVKVFSATLAREIVSLLVRSRL